MVVAQEWPCWLSVLSLNLPFAGAYFPSCFHQFFRTPKHLKLMNGWQMYEAFKPRSDRHIVLISGSPDFIKGVNDRVKADAAIILIGIVDARFEKLHPRDHHRSLVKAPSTFYGGGLLTGSVRHYDFGGVTNATHTWCAWGVSHNAFIGVGVPRRLSHIGNSAAKGWFTEIDAPTVSADAVVRAPIVVDRLLRQEGLYGVYRPTMLCAVPCGFKTSRWVKRQLTPHELLRVFDSPIAMDISLCHDADAITALSHTATPLVISSILRNLWGQVGGSGGNSVENSDDIAIDVPQRRRSTSPHEQVSAILDSQGKGRPVILAQ